MAKQAIDWTEEDWQATARYGEEHAGEWPGANSPTGDALIAQTVTERTERLVAKYNAAVLDRINQLFTPRPR